VQAGAIFVNQTFEEYLHALFTSAKLSAEESEDYLQDALESFETGTKRVFDGSDHQDLSIQIGGRRFVNRSIGVRRGIMEPSW
jgi:hypothetical protein